MSATHKQKLAFANIWDHYKFNPTETHKLNVQDSPQFLIDRIFSEPCPAEIKRDINRIRTLSSCVRP